MFICIVKRRASTNQPLVLKKGMAGITARFFDCSACRQAGLLANKSDSNFATTSSRSVRKKAVCEIKINEDGNTKYSKPVFVEGF
jgi:hypothetical protein